MHRDRCLCDLIPNIETKTRLSLVIHTKELRRTTNTGTLAAKALSNSEVLVRGKVGEPLDLKPLLTDNYRHVLFYPSDDAVELTSEFVRQSSLPIQLIVPDGNWRQAGKVHLRHPELAAVPRVAITVPNTMAFHLRAESTSFGMATLQAIAHAYGIIEGDHVKDALLRLYRAKLDRTLEGRGTKTSGLEPREPLDISTNS
ncbi:MAG: DTW domain-containing protein [Bdellovibrionales bacterium]|nr:DTW domain-containing protein [Bdellovibrionales bacterium]